MVSGQIAAMPWDLKIISTQRQLWFATNVHARRTAKTRQRGKTMEDIIMLQKMQRVAFYNSSLTSGNKII